MDKLNDWVAMVREYAPTEWERLPELDLYMDQVITLMNKQLAPFTTDGDQLLTPSMINNYVKDGVLPRPVQKKYSRDHLAMLMMVCILKSVLSLSEIHSILQGLTVGHRVEELYPDFSAEQSRALHEVADRVNSKTNRSREDMYRLAVGLALEANARRSAAARILDNLQELEDDGEKKERDKSKKE